MSFVIRNGLLVPKREIIRRKTEHLRVPHAPLILRRIHCPIVKPIVSAVATDNNPGTGVGTLTAATLAFTNFTVGTGSNRALVAILGYTVGATAISVVWDQAGANQSLTNIISATDGGGQTTISLWGLVNPTSGVNKTITANWTTSVIAGLSAVSFTGVNQTGGTTSFAHSTSNTGSLSVNGTSNVSVTTATTDAVVAAVGCNTLGVSSMGQTKIFVDGTSDLFGGNLEIGGASPQSMTATLTAACPGSWVMVGVDVVASGASGDTLGGANPRILYT